MKSIFQYKQYNAKFQSSGYREKTRISKNINDLDWEISPIGEDLGETFHNREINLALLETNNYLEDYTYSIVHIDEEGYRYTFIYTGDWLHYYKKYNKMDADYMVDKKISFSFDEACEFIKNEMK